MWIRHCICIWCILAIVNGQLMPVVEHEDDNLTRHILGIISVIDQYAVIRNFITFFGDQEDAITASFHQRLMKTFNRPVIVAGAHIGPLHNIINDKNMAVVLFKGMDDPILEVMHKSLDKIHTIQILFVHQSDTYQHISTDQIKAFFNWCWNNHYHRVSLSFKSNNKYEVWSYKMKEELNIYKISNTQLNKRIKLSYRNLGNMGQRKTVIAVCESIPHTFVFNSSDTFGNNITLGGQTGILLKEFMRFVNGSMDILHLEFNEYIEKVHEGNAIVDIGANMMFNNALILYTSRVMSTRMCMVLPHERQITLEAYTVFYNQDLSLLLFVAFYFIANAVIKRISNPGTTLSNLLFASFRLATGQSMATRAFRRLRLSEKIIEMFTHVFNILVISLIGSTLASALITGLNKPKIMDAETFLESGLRIMVTPHQMLYIFDHIPPMLRDRVLIADVETVNQHMLSLNDSFAYVTPTHKWILYEYLQKRLRKPKLRLAPDKLCGFEMYLMFYVRSGLSFNFVLNYFVNQARETGLTDKWTQMGLIQAQQAKFISQAPYDPPTEKPLSMKYFKTCFAVYAGGVLLSSLSLLLEFAYMRWNNRNDVIIL